LALYGAALGKTVLRPSQLPPFDGSLPPDLPKEGSNAVAYLANELSKSGIEVLHDGPHFVRVFPANRPDQRTNPPLRGTELSSANSREILPAGTINFPSTDLEQVLMIYRELRQRTLLRTGILPSMTVQLRTVCPLNREEAAYAISTVLGLNGLSCIDDGDHFTQLVLAFQAAQVKTNAPKVSPNAELLDPRKVPTIGDRRTYSQWELKFEKARKLVYDFVNKQDPRDRPADRLLELYAGLADKKAVLSPKLGGSFIRFTVDQPLTKDELLYAIETTLRLNNLAVVDVDKDSVRLGHLSEVTRAQTR
jgi:hypothetical protein